MRVLSLDLLRTIAVIGMIVYHAVYDLAVFFEAPLDPFSDGWTFLARATAVLFLFVSGMSGAIAVDRSFAAGGVRMMWRRSARRFLRIGSAAALVTAVTYAVNPATYVRFGILHCFAVTALLLPLARPLGRWNALLGGGVIAAGLAVRGTVVDTPLLLPFGAMYPGFRTIDYFPLFPWSGVVFIGYALGQHVLPRWNTRSLASAPYPLAPMFWPGRHALLVYLLHQPILLAMLWVVREVS